MSEIDEPTLRQLCERASKELDSRKLLDLVEQINSLLDRSKDLSTPKDGGELGEGMKHAS